MSAARTASKFVMAALCAATLTAMASSAHAGASTGTWKYFPYGVGSPDYYGGSEQAYPSYGGYRQRPRDYGGGYGYGRRYYQTEPTDRYSGR